MEFRAWGKVCEVARNSRPDAVGLAVPDGISYPLDHFSR